MIEDGAEKSPIFLTLYNIVLYKLRNVLGLKVSITDQEPDEDSELVFVPGLVITRQTIIIKPKLSIEYLVVIK